MLQPEPRSGEGCITLAHEGLENVKIQKLMLNPHCYISSFQAEEVPNNVIQLYAKIMKGTTKPHQIGNDRKRQYFDERRRKIVRNRVFNCH